MHEWAMVYGGHDVRHAEIAPLRLPWIGSDLLWDCFELASEVRVLDMQAGPYDLSALGFIPVRVETPEGRDEYQQRQRDMSAWASVLRARLIEGVGAMLQTVRSQLSMQQLAAETRHAQSSSGGR